MRRKRSFVVWAIALAMLAVVWLPRVARADSDILLGMFYTSDSNYTDSIYVSYDGNTMTRVATTYDNTGGNAYKDSKGKTHYGHSDPSIMYYNGKFWALSGWNKRDGKFWPIISYSTDLVHWTHPEGDKLLTGTHGVSLNVRPSGYKKTDFDTVAPEWFISKNGSVYIIFSAGYYGAFRGHPTEDKMQTYITKVTQLSASNGSADGNTKYLWPNNLTFKAETAKRINIPGNSAATADFIDGSGYTEGGYDYLLVKQGGLTNKLFRTSNIDGNSWTEVNSRVLHGWEGGSLAKFAGKYFMAADHVVGATADGVKMFSSTSLTKQNWGQTGTKFVDKAGKAVAVRHGSIITLKAGSAAWKVAANLLKPSVGSATVSGIGSVYEYTGKAITPKPTVKIGSTTLRANTDYVVSYANNVKVGTATVTIKGKGTYTGTKTVKFKIVSQASVQYYVHRQTYGWETAWSKKNGDQSGTTGESKRLEGIRIRLTDKAYSGSIQYRTHIQTFGWENGWKADGGMSGTTGMSKRLEAIQIRLTGNMAKYYDVYYRVHAQRLGWMGWAKNGASSGTAGYSYRLEAIQIVLVKKGKPAPATTLKGAKQNYAEPYTDKNHDLNKATVSLPKSSYVYTGAAIKPAPVVKHAGATLKAGTHYNVSYANNVKAGTATVTVSGKGTYSGSKRVTFKITAANIASAAVSGLGNQTYTGKALTPAPTVKLGSVTLKANTDYTVTYAKNVNVGTATVTIKGKGSCTGTKTATFKIVAASIAKATISGLGSMTYTGNALTPAPTVKLGAVTLKANTDYTVKYENNVNAGQATVTITGKGNYTGTKTATFTIRADQKTDTKAAASSYSVQADEVDLANAEIKGLEDQQYTGSEIEPKLVVSLNGVDLVEGQDYDLQFADNKEVGTATVTVTGKGNYTGTKVGHFQILASEAVESEDVPGEAVEEDAQAKLVDLANANVVELDAAEDADEPVAAKQYTGEEIQPKLSVTLGDVTLVEGTDYELVYANNIEVGTATVTIKGIGGYTGTQVIEFTIVEKVDTDDVESPDKAKAQTADEPVATQADVPGDTEPMSNEG